MANYDSDSESDSGAQEYTTTNVILGYAASDPAGDEISHVGGYPVWIDALACPPSSLVKCKVCNGYMALLLQLNADLAQFFPDDQRRLSVWTCRNKACSRKFGSVRAVREVKKKEKERKVVQSPPTEVVKTTLDLGGALFGATGSSSLDGNANVMNPFALQSGSSSMVASANPFSGLGSLAAKPPQVPDTEKQGLVESFADKLNVGGQQAQAQQEPATWSDPWPENDKFPQPYAFFYLDAYPEELDPTPETTVETAGESSETKYHVDDSTSSALEKDTFESSLDKTFQKFSDLVAQNPEQVLRYEFKGQPLLYSESDNVASRFIVSRGKVGAVKGMPRCEKCGSQRVFEMQLTPNLIFEVEKDEAIDIDSGMEWGTIIVGTCVNNCGEDGAVSFREEWVGVQWEERVVRR